MMTAYFAIDRQTMANGCIKLLKGSNHLGRIDHGTHPGLPFGPATISSFLLCCTRAAPAR